MKLSEFRKLFKSKYMIFFNFDKYDNKESIKKLSITAVSVINDKFAA